MPQDIDAHGRRAAASAEALTPRADARAITIDTTGLEPAPVWADPLRLRQVVDNLLSNAIAYNRDGGTVFLGTTTDGASSWILVRDTGVGISEADRSRLFQRFYKAGAAAAHRHRSRPRHHARHRPRARRRPRAAQLARRGLDLHRQAARDGRARRAPTPPRRDRPVTLDLASVLVMTALVVNVSGILFIVETLLRRDEGAGRVWALGVPRRRCSRRSPTSCGCSRPTPGGRSRSATRAFVAGTGCMWLGCRRFNGRRMALVVGDRRRRRARRGGRRRRRRSGRRRLGRRAVDVRPAARIRRRRRRGVPSRRTRRVAHGLGARRRARLPVAVLRVADDGVRHLRSRQRPLPERRSAPCSTSFLTVTLTIVAVVVTSVLRATQRADARLPAARGRRADARRHPLARICSRAPWAASASGRAAASELVGVIARAHRRAGPDLDRVRQRGRPSGERGVADRSAAARPVERARRRRRADRARSSACSSTRRREARRVAGAIYRGLFEDLGARRRGSDPGRRHRRRAQRRRRATTRPRSSGSRARRRAARPRASRRRCSSATTSSGIRPPLRRQGRGQPVSDAADGLDPPRARG